MSDKSNICESKVSQIKWISVHAVERYIQRVKGKQIHSKKISTAYFANTLREMQMRILNPKHLGGNQYLWNRYILVTDKNGTYLITLYLKRKGKLYGKNIQRSS